MSGRTATAGTGLRWVLALLSALPVAAGCTASSAGGNARLECVAAPGTGDAGTMLAQRLCQALTPAIDTLPQPSGWRAEILHVEKTGFSARLGRMTPSGYRWGPDLGSSSMDIDHIPQSAIDDMVEALVMMDQRLD